LVDDLLFFDRGALGSARRLLSPRDWRQAWALFRRLRQGHYDTTVFFHHFSTRYGALKFAAMAWSAGSLQRIGLQNGSAFFLTESLPDEGFGAKHQAQYWLDLVELLGADSSPRPCVVNIAPPSQVLHLLTSPQPAILHAQSSVLSPQSLRIVIHAGSGGDSRARRWDAEKFAALADALHEQDGAQIILVGGPNDAAAQVKAAMKTTPLDLSGKTTLPQLAAVLKSSDLFIGADSGVSHLAGAVGMPLVVIFGPSNHEAWRPWTPNGRCIILRSAPECSPCSYVGQHIGQREGCAARTCMRMVTVDHVLEAARRVLQGDSVGTQHTVSVQAWRPNPTSTNRVRILGLPVAAVTYEEWLARIGEWVQSGRCHHVCTINPEFMMVAQRDRDFFNILNRADLCIPDGVGLLWAARYLGKPLPERVTGSDGVPKIAERAAQTGWRLFFLGAASGVAERAASVLRVRYPGVQIVGTYSGSPAGSEEDALVERVNGSGTDILFVAYGAPEQDKWIARNLPRLNMKMAMGVGGAFDFIAGVVPRAPQWMQDLGIEWLFRLMRQPWRLRRMLRLPRFVLVVLLRGEKE
jgi:N-acetylglucosaminyldiphosphoundecaprenol N-acetyl-beta-D-mannosaminyltransferase